MMGDKICFYDEKWIIIPKLSLLLLLIWSTGAYCARSYAGERCYVIFPTPIISFVTPSLRLNID